MRNRVCRRVGHAYEDVQFRAHTHEGIPTPFGVIGRIEGGTYIIRMCWRCLKVQGTAVKSK